MNIYKRTLRYLNSAIGGKALTELYGETMDVGIPVQNRFLALAEKADSLLPGGENIGLFSSPGRVELGGNHTDHENGRVLAAAVTQDTIALATPIDTDVIRINSAGYGSLEIQLSDLTHHPEVDNTSLAMVKGICQFLYRNGYRIGGFHAIIESTVPSGSGMSSSASFQVLIGLILNNFYNQGNLTPFFLARAGQFAEVEYARKPSGLMDQMASVLGGAMMIDFLQPEMPLVEAVHFDLETCGYKLVITETGGSHANLTSEYAGIKEENHAVAQYFGKTVLREVDEAVLMTRITEMREIVGDRAILRAIHFIDENKRVLAQAEALKSGDFERYLFLVRDSGSSSWQLLQNTHSPDRSHEQGIPLGLALSAQILGREGAWRVHGGGFAGTVQAYVPSDKFSVYRKNMDSVFGEGSCRQVKVRSCGARSLTEIDEI